MKIKVLAIGKTDSQAFAQQIADYTSRVRRYISLEFEALPDVKNAKNLSENEQKQKEAKAVLAKISAGDTLVILDEKGKQFSSVDFANYLQKLMNSGIKSLVFVIGGPYGIDDTLKQKARESWSLSLLTFSHQMVRLFVVEQIYRAMTILNNQPYHHR